MLTTRCSISTGFVHCKEDPIYVFPDIKMRGLVPNFHFHLSLTDTWMQELGTRPRSFISGNFCFEFSVQCLCSVSSKHNVLILNIWEVKIGLLFSKGPACYGNFTIYIIPSTCTLCISLFLLCALYMHTQCTRALDKLNINFSTVSSKSISLKDMLYS